MTEKQFTKRPDWSQLESIWLDRYDGSNYERGLSAWVLRHTHSLVENDQNLQDNYPVVLELGVGTMAHFPFVRHWFEEYIASDHDPKVIDWLNSRTWDGRVSITQFDSSEIPLEDNLSLIHI